MRAGDDRQPRRIVGISAIHSAGQHEHSIVTVNYAFRRDGKVVRTGHERCGMTPLEPYEQTWKTVEDRVEGEFVGGEFDGRTWRITPGEDRDHIRVYESFNGRMGTDFTMTRGEVCARRETGCTAGECFCETYYCDGPPPPCEEASAP